MRNKLILTAIVMLSVLFVYFFIKGNTNYMSAKDVNSNKETIVFSQNGPQEIRTVNVASNNVFRVFRESNQDNRQKAADAVVFLLKNQYIGKCSKEDITKWLGSDFVNFFDSQPDICKKDANKPESNPSASPNKISIMMNDGRMFSVEIVDMSYLVRENQSGAMKTQIYLSLRFDDNKMLNFVGYNSRHGIQ